MNHPDTAYHIPALLEQTINLLEIDSDGVYVDATFGGGGHSRAILNKLGPKGKLFGFDRDLDALKNVPDDPRFTFVHSDFRFITNFLKFYGCPKVDGIIADLGVSFHHFDTPERGFSFRSRGPLDMRMNQNAPKSAREILADISESELRDLLRRNTDLRNAPSLAKKICIERRNRPIEYTTDLVETIEPLLDPKNVKKEMAQVFQALRIATNNEDLSLRELFLQSLKVLEPGGRIAVLTYHSGEDRMVKEFFKNGSFNKEAGNEELIYGVKRSPWKLITRNPVTASAEEILVNPRARSAKLRVAQLQ